MAAQRRLQKELCKIQMHDVSCVRQIEADESNILTWRALVVPKKEPYSKGAFRIEINFPKCYPFKPPVVLFQTRIYHPNIDEEGKVCLPIISPESWKPATMIKEVMISLVHLVHNPDLKHPLRMDLAEEYQKNRKQFLKNAKAFTEKFSEKRP